MIMVLLSFSSVQAATITSKITGGAWNNTDTWEGGVVPSTTLTANNDVIIKGYVTLTGSLILNGGILDVQDTLVITGNISMPNEDGISLKVGAKAVLIILGNYTSKNKVLVENGGSIVIGGTIDSNGAKAGYSGETESLIYAVGGGSAYNLPTCSTPGPNCIGTGAQLSQTPLGQFFSSLTSSYSLVANSTCFTNTGIPVNLSFSPTPPANVINIKWYRNGTQIHTWESVTSITEWSAGVYSASYVLNTDSKTYWAKGIAVLGATGTISGATSVFAASTNTYTLSTTTPNATYYQWSVPSGSTIISGQGSTSITVKAGTQVGNISVTPKNGTSSGCTASTLVNIRDASCDCSTTGQYWSKNNYTGLWSNADSWGNVSEAWNPNPPPTNGTGTGAANTLCISGTITANSDLIITGGTKTICDTLIVTGNLTDNNCTFNITSTGVLIVLGNYTGINGGQFINAGKVVIAGNSSIAYSNTYSGSGAIYTFNPVLLQNVTPTGTSLAALQANDPQLYNTFMNAACGTGISGGTIASEMTVCSGTDIPAFTSTADASPAGAISYQWYFSTNSNTPASGTWNLISGASGNVYNHGVVTQTSYFYRKATKGGGCSANSNVVTVSVDPVPDISLITPAEVCEGENLFSLSYSNSTGAPVTYSIIAGNPALAGFVAISDASIGTSPLSVSIPSTSTSGNYQFILSIKNNNCVSTNKSFSLQITTPPKTGALYRKPNN